MFDISKFQNICQCSCKKKLVRGVFRRFLSTQKYPLAALPHWRSACADLRTANSIPTLTVKRAIFHGSCAKCFTSARAASCDLFPGCRANRCDADDARAREGLPLSPYRLRWRHSPPDINRSNMRTLDAQNQPLHHVFGISQHIIPLLVMKMLIKCSKIRLATQ